MYPCNDNVPRAPGLYTYYAMMSLLVVILAVTLIWIPFVQLITEFNTIIAKIVIYFNVEFLGYKDTQLSNTLETVFLSQQSLVLTTVCCIAFALYLASSDFLVFAGCYVCNLPNTKYLKTVKQVALAIIKYLLHLRGEKRVFEVKGNILEGHENHHM